MYTYTVHKVITDTKALKPSEGKGEFRGLIKTISVISRGVGGGLLLAFGYKAGVRDALKEKLQGWPLGLNQKQTVWFLKKKNEGGKKEGGEFTAVSEINKGPYWLRLRRRRCREICKVRCAAGNLNPPAPENKFDYFQFLMNDSSLYCKVWIIGPAI